MKKVTEMNHRIGKAINEGLARRNMTQTELAREVGSTQRSISSYVTGYTQPPLDILKNICLVLEINLNQVMQIPEYPYPYRAIKEPDDLEYLDLLDGLANRDKKDFIHTVKELRKLIHDIAGK